MEDIDDVVGIMAFPNISANHYVDILTHAQNENMDINEVIANRLLFFYNNEDVENMLIYLAVNGIYVKLLRLVGPSDI